MLQRYNHNTASDDSILPRSIQELLRHPATSVILHLIFPDLSHWVCLQVFQASWWLPSRERWSSWDHQKTVWGTIVDPDFCVGCAILCSMNTMFWPHLRSNCWKCLEAMKWGNSLLVSGLAVWIIHLGICILVVRSSVPTTESPEVDSFALVACLSH